MFALLALSGCKKDEIVITEYKIKYETDGNGAITGEATQTVVEGKDCSAVTAIPNAGYRFVEWSDGIETPERQDKNIIANMTVTAQFERLNYKLSYAAGKGGYLKGTSNQTVSYGESGESVTAIPNVGYKFVSWSDGIETPERQDKNIIADKTVTAQFERINYTLSYAAGKGGYLKGTSNQTVSYGESGESVTAIPNVGYKFVSWSDGIETPERQDKNIRADKTVTAQFEKVSYTLRYLTDGNGRIEGKAEQAVNYCESGESVTAVPNVGYKFVSWSDGITTPERQDKNITTDKTVIAEFEKIVYKVNYQADAGGTIDGQSEQLIKYGEDAVFVVAVPNAGYRFVKWSDGNGSTIRRETCVTSEINVTAEFEFLYDGGDGSEINPFIIANYTQLNDIWYNPEANFKLINDLDLSGINHEPIFDIAYYFKGKFDGGNHAINNLTVATEINYPSLFGVIGGGIVRNLQIINANIITTNYNTFKASDKYYVGIVAGMVKGYVQDVSVTGAIIAEELNGDGVAIGGLCGYANGTIANCQCDVRLNIKKAICKSINYPFIFGGMIGVSDSAFIRDCGVKGQINITESYWTESGSTGDLNKSTEILAGGLIGYYFTDRQVNSYIKNCETNVVISGDNHYKVGGFVGRLMAGQDTVLRVTDCFVYGDVTCGRVGGFAYEVRTSGVSSLLIENCIVENDITAFSYGTGFIYQCFSSSDGDLEIKNCNTSGNIKTHYVFDSERVFGRAAGFGWQMSYVSIMNSYVKRNINSSDGRGFSCIISYSEISSCLFEGVIDLSNAEGSLRGVGMFDNFSSSKLDNCYVNVKFVTGEKDTSNLYALIRQGGGKLSNFYCYGNYCKIFENYNMQNVSNGHVFKGNIEESNLPQESDGTAISLYDNIQDMYLLADELNDGQDEENWVNVENALPKLKFEIR